MWCASERNSIIGLYFFEEENEKRVTMNTDHFVSLVRTKLILARRKKSVVNLLAVTSQQDGASSHCIFCLPMSLSKTTLEFSANISLAINLFHKALTFVGNPTFLVSTHPTTFCGLTRGKYPQQQSLNLDSFEDNIKRKRSAYQLK